MNLIIVVITTVGVWITAARTGWSLLYVLAWLLTLTIALGYLWARQSVRGLRVDHSVEADRVTIGELVRERISVQNRSVLPKPWLEVVPEGTLPRRRGGGLMHLGPGGEQSCELESQTTARGRYDLGPICVTSGDIFGLWTRSARAETGREVLVRPQVVPVSTSLVVSPTRSGHATGRAHPGRSSSAVSIREYAPTDGLGRVSWKASARLGKLMSKEFDPESAVETWIVLDLDRAVHVHAGGLMHEPGHTYLGSTVEYGITIAASLCAEIIRTGGSVGLLSWADSRVLLSPGRGRRHLESILDELAVLQPSTDHRVADLVTAHLSLLLSGKAVFVISPADPATWLNVFQETAVSSRVVGVLLDRQSFLTPNGETMDQSIHGYRGGALIVVRNGDDIAQVLGGRRGASAHERWTA